MVPPEDTNTLHTAEVLREIPLDDVQVGDSLKILPGEFTYE